MRTLAWCLLLLYLAGWIVLLTLWLELGNGARWAGLLVAALWPLVVPLLSLYAIAVYAHEFWLRVRPPSEGREP